MEIASEEELSVDLLDGLAEEIKDPEEEAQLYPKDLDEITINKRSFVCKWAYTDFQLDRVRFHDNEVKYLIEGNEVCPSTKRKHIQGFVWLTKGTRWTALKARFPNNMRFVPARGSPWQNFVYCSKEGDFKEVGDRPKEQKQKTDVNAAFKEAFSAETVQAGLEIIKEKRARDYCLYGDTIERSLKKAHSKPFVPKYKIGDFNQPAQDLSKPVLFCGPTNIGKTQFAISHFQRPLVCSHIDNLKQLSPDNDGIIFDDMNFNHWPANNVIHLLDSDIDRSLHVRWGTVTIPANTKKIFTYNSDNPFYLDTVKQETKDAIERRLNRINFYSSLYTKQQ